MAFFWASWDPMRPTAPPGPKYMKRIQKELSEVYTDPPAGILIVADDKDITLIHAILIGPEGTPYEGGFFYFVARYPPGYPFEPPRVRLMTTAGASVQFSPNLYACGKVCLSTLGTWAGQPWSPGGTMVTTLVSIRSLLSEQPYHNEPGFEGMRAPPSYNRLLRHETVRVAVVGMLDNDYNLALPTTLLHHIERVFLERFEFYEKLAVNKLKLDGKRMKDPFNYISGRFDYKTILARLRSIQSRLQKPDPVVALPPAAATTEPTEGESGPPAKSRRIN